MDFNIIATIADAPAEKMEEATEAIALLLHDKFGIDAFVSSYPIVEPDPEPEIDEDDDDFEVDYDDTLDDEQDYYPGDEL